MTSLGRALSDQATRRPTAVAAICDGKQLTWAELDRASSRIASRLAQDVRKDDFVAVSLPNGLGFVKAIAAVWKLGAIPLPMSPKLAAPERAAVFHTAQPRVVIDAETEEEGEVNVRLEDRAARSWKAILSGGSTGSPKVIVDGRPGSFGPHVLNSTMREGDHILIPGPLHHNAGFKYMANALFGGGTAVLMTRFDAQQCLELAERYRVQWLSLVPTMMQRIWRLPGRRQFDLSALRVLMHAAAPCPAWLKQSYIDWLGAERILEIYGGAENTGLTAISGAEWLEHRGSVGRPLPGHVFRIFDPEGQEAPAGVVGEVYSMPPEGPGSTYSYIGATPRRRIDGWESIGDLGYLDAEGYLYIVDRRTDMILRGGANIYPAEIEAALEQHPAVRSSAVIGLPDDDLGNRVHAIVEAADVGADELAVFLAARLSRYKLPASYEFVDRPLRDDAGKSRRSALRASRLAPAQRPQPTPVER